MNEFHEINILTSRGDINEALSLIGKWSESIARKIMKKAGYSVTPHAGRAFWTWVQATLTDSARQRRCGYRVRAERRAPVRYSRQQALENYDAYVQMMASDVTPRAEAAPQAEVAPLDTGPEKSVAVCGRTESLILLRRHGKPAPARAVPVLQLQHACGRIVSRAAEKRRGYIMSVHGVIPGRSMMNKIVDRKSAGHPYRMPEQGKTERHTPGCLLTAHPLHVRYSEPPRAFTVDCKKNTRRNRDPAPPTAFWRSTA
ncbi:hypothetical protein [Pantoea agglomerans]|uniref:hypothetical protein n=1 Tax=Enterobacter agglomerans TaxID=549 RepID=UPI003C7DE36A